MNFSPQQETALLRARKWFGSDDQVFRLFGYAGTGKTTLAQTLAQDCGRVLFAAYTGKAASVMRARGCPEAMTIHQAIYKPAGNSTKLLLELEKNLADLLRGFEIEAEADQDPKVQQLRKLIKDETNKVTRPNFVLNPESVLHYCDLVIIDECSMVDGRMGEDLLSFGKKILVLGDPAQLPPVRGEGFFTSGKPDIVLTEIHRQARGNPIIDLATRVRSGEAIPFGNWGNSSCQPVGNFNKDMVRGVDQVIVGRNETRKKFNRNYRQNILGFDNPLPLKGDKLVCLRNNHDLGILNGQLYSVQENSESLGDVVDLVLDDGSEHPTIVGAHTGHFLGKEIPWWDKKSAEEFDYGYALTCHKSQGSQWPNVMVFDESNCFRDTARQWLYTAITRASESITILR